MSNGKLFIGLLALYFVTCLLAWNFGGIRVSGDAIGYFQLAENLKAENGFSRCDSPPFLPDSSRTPIYPLFILFFMAVFGSHFSPLVIVLAQAALASLALVMIKKALDKIGAFPITQAAAFAVVFLGISPTFIDAILMAYSEILLLFFAAVLLLQLVKFFGQKSRQRAFLNAALIGIILGIMTLTKPICQFMPLVLIGLLASRKRLRESGLLLAGFLLAVSPWLWRNYSVFGRADISSIDDYNICEYTARPLLSTSEYKDYQQISGILALVDDKSVGATQLGYFSFSHGDRYRHCGLSIIKDHWKAYTKKALVNLLDFPFSRGSNILTRVFALDYKAYRELPWEARMKNPRALAVFAGASWELLYRSLFYILCLLGIYQAFRSRRLFTDNALVLALLTALYFIVIISVTQLDDFDQNRLILPAQLALTFFLPFGIGTAAGRLRSSKPGSD
ncbi:MAG: glycosyltransferase family 39 protein [Candidatus Aminicenantales bacterium]